MTLRRKHFIALGPTDVTTSRVAVSPAVAAAVAEISVHGTWSQNLGLNVTAALRSCFADRPAGIIIDLGGLSDDAAASLPLWLAARRTTAVMRPPVRLVLCLPSMTTLHERLRYINPERLPLYGTMADARTALARPPVMGENGEC